MGAVHQNRDLCLCVGIRAGWNRSVRQNSGAIMPTAEARMPVAAFTEPSKALYHATARPIQFNGSTQRDVQVGGIPESVRYPNFVGNVLLHKDVRNTGVVVQHGVYLLAPILELNGQRPVMAKWPIL